MDEITVAGTVPDLHWLPLQSWGLALALTA